MKALIIQPSYFDDDMRTHKLEAERQGRVPRWSDFDAAFDTVTQNFFWLEQAPWHRRLFYRVIPAPLALACEAFVHRKEYDIVISWTEQLSVFFALLQCFTFHRTPHLVLVYWLSKTNVKLPMSIVQRAIGKIVTWTSVQRDFAAEVLKIPAERLTLVQHFVDHEFWNSRTGERKEATDRPYICSAGAEMRDYQTLIAAMEGLPFECRIATREIRLLRGLNAVTINPGDMAGSLPDNVLMKSYDHLELRELYQNSKFVVMPLLPSDTDNGITVILEAMSAGKTVICTRTKGQVDAIEDGVTGIFVDGGDPDALRAAILDQWHDPEKAELLGCNARAYVEASRHPLERFAEDVKHAAYEIVAD